MPQNGETHSTNSSAICRRIAWAFDQFVELALKGLTPCIYWEAPFSIEPHWKCVPMYFITCSNANNKSISTKEFITMKLVSFYSLWLTINSASPLISGLVFDFMIKCLPTKLLIAYHSSLLSWMAVYLYFYTKLIGETITSTSEIK